MAWADRNPVSPRAQAYAAQFEIALGAIDAAQSRLRQAIKLHPHEPQLTFNLLDAECANGALNFDSVSEAETAIRYNPAAAALDFNWLSEAIPKARENQCRGLDLSIIERLLRAAEQNSNFARAPGRLQDFAHLQGLVDLNKGEIDKALTDFESAVDALPTLSLALEQASLLGDAGRADLGLQHLDRFVANHPLPKTRIHLSSASLHEWLLGRMNFWQDETARVRSLLQQATASSGSVPQL